MEKKSPIFDYIRTYWDWAEENPEKVNTTNAAIYFHFLHIANSLRWKKSFGVTAGQTMSALGIGSVKTYRKHFEELIESGLVEIVKRSTNQYSCHIIALPKITQAPTYHVHDHLPEQLPTTYLSSAPIHNTLEDNKDNEEKKDIKEVSSETKPKSFKQWSVDDFKQSIAENRLNYSSEMLNDFYGYWTEMSAAGKPRFVSEKTWETPKRLKRWFNNNSKFKPTQQQQTFTRSSIAHYS